MSNAIIRFIHISDTHIGTSEDVRLYNENTYEAANQLINNISQLPFIPDFIIHTGDVSATHGEKDSYILAAELFKNLKTPIYFVTGNHDNSKNMIDYLSFGEKTAITRNPDVNAYQFDVKGIRCVVLDARGPDSIDPHGLLPQEQLDALEKEIQTGTQPLAIFIHFFPLPLDSTWLDERMLLLNGETFHNILLKGKQRIRGVFTGHIHRGIQHYQDGILYSSAGSSFLQFYSYPGQPEPLFQHDNTGFYNIVSMTKQSTIVRQEYYSIKNTT